MRITDNMIANNSIYNLQQFQTNINQLTLLTTSQQNINQPSDNPGATNTLLNINDSLNAITQYQTNITNATTSLNVANNALTGITSSIEQAQELVDSISNGTIDASTQQSDVRQLQALKQQIVDYGNTQSGNTYVFGGTSSTQPFSTANNTYNGNDNPSKIEVTKNTYQNVNISGDSLLTGTGSNPSYGSTNILSTIDNLVTTLQNAPTDPTTAQQTATATAIQRGATALAAGLSQVQNATYDVTSRLQNLTAMSTMNTNNQTTLQNTVSNIQNVNLDTVGTELSQEQTAYQAALSATAQISKMSLLNYLS